MNKPNNKLSGQSKRCNGVIRCQYNSDNFMATSSKEKPAVLDYKIAAEIKK